MSTTYIGENPAPGMAVIYSLRETPDGPRRYIGSTSLTMHNRKKKHHTAMLKRLPVMVVELIVPVERQRFHEQQMIDACRDCGLELENKINVFAKCGTYTGYGAHRRRGEKACDDCLRALREYSRITFGHKPLSPAKCGTNSGYVAHRNRQEEICDACRQAHNEDGREYTRKRFGYKPQHPAKCGTESGYNRHYRRGETPCSSCRQVHIDRQRTERANRKMKVS